MSGVEKFKKAHYKTKTVFCAPNGAVCFDPESQKNVVGCENMSYDEYLDVQIYSDENRRVDFENCFFNSPIEFKGKIEKINKSKICFERVYVSGMFPDGEMFDGKEDHVWMDKEPFGDCKVGESYRFVAEVYRYLKTSNGKSLDYGLRNSENIEKIRNYELPSDDELLMQGIKYIVCESCFLYDNCNHINCMLPRKDINNKKKDLFNFVKGEKK